VLFSVAVAAERRGPFVVRLLAYATVFVVDSRLHSNVSGFAWFVVTTQAGQASYLCQINWIGVTNNFQFDPLRYAEGAFEQCAWGRCWR
jgi:hypothetical protein